MPYGPPPSGFGPPAPPVWTPPTEIEQALLDAKARNDWAAYFDVLARQRLYFEIRRDKADVDEDGVFPVFGHDPRIGGLIWAVYTPGMLPPPEPNRVFTWHNLGWFARQWRPTDPPMIVVDPGSPCEAFLPGAPPHSSAWSQHAPRGGGDPEPGLRLRTLRVGGPLRGPVARGLACGALLCVSNGSLWNAMAWHGTGYPGERRRLREWWGITSRAEWRSALRGLLDCEAHSSVWDFALQVRRTIARDFGGHVDVGYWRQAVATVIRANSEGSVVVTDDGVTKTDPRPEFETEARIEGVQRLIGRITRYEARMRADGILGGNRYVSSLDAWDLGRASKMARWGLGARFGTLEEAESAVLQAGRSAALSYTSWQDFSAGYILGRCLHFDDEEFGKWYQEMIEAHQILMSEPDSPWLTVPFR